jgi:hypothetical protein
MDYFERQFMDIVTKVAALMGPVVAKYIYLGVYIPSGISKIVAPEPVVEMFPSLPAWFWPAAGVFELVHVGFFLTGNFAIAIPMSYVFMGGVISACTVLHPKQALSLPMPAFFLILASIHGNNNGFKVFPALPIFTAAGFGIGVFLGKIIGRKAPGKAN